MSRYTDDEPRRRSGTELRISESRRARDPQVRLRSGQPVDQEKIKVDVIKAPNITKRFNFTKDEKEYERQQGRIGVARHARWTDVTGDVVTDYDTIQFGRPYRQNEPLPAITVSAPHRPVKRQISLTTFDRPPRPRYDTLDVEVEDDIAPKSAVTSRASRTIYREEDVMSQESFDESEYREVEVDAIYVAATDTNSSTVSSWARSVAASTQRDGAICQATLRSASSRHGGSQTSSRSSRSSRSGDNRSISAASVASSATSRSGTSSSKSYSMAGARGKTRFPKRLAKRTVLMDMRLEYDSEDEHYMVHRALNKADIDQIICLSKDRADKGAKRYLYPHAEEEVEEQEEVVENVHDRFPPGEILQIRREWINPPSDCHAPRPRRRCSSPERPAIYVQDERKDAKKMTIVVKDGQRSVSSPVSAPVSSCSSPSRATTVRPRRRAAAKDVEIVERDYHRTTWNREYDHDECNDHDDWYRPSVPRCPPVRLISTKRADVVEYRPTDEGGKEYVVADVCDEPKRTECSSRRGDGWIRLRRDSRDDRRRTGPGAGAVAFYMSTLA